MLHDSSGDHGILVPLHDMTTGPTIWNNVRRVTHPETRKGNGLLGICSSTPSFKPSGVCDEAGWYKRDLSIVQIQFRLTDGKSDAAYPVSDQCKFNLSAATPMQALYYWLDKPSTH